MILISNDFWHKIKMYNFEPYNVLLSIAVNIAVLLMTVSRDTYSAKVLNIINDEITNTPLMSLEECLLTSVGGVTHYK